MLRPDELRPQGAEDPLRLYEKRQLEVHAGDRHSLDGTPTIAAA